VGDGTIHGKGAFCLLKESRHFQEGKLSSYVMDLRVMSEEWGKARGLFSRAHEIDGIVGRYFL
jgi:hypothetical protein